MRSRCRCSMCPAIHTNSRSWLRSSSTHEPSDPPLRVVFSPFRPFPEESPNWEVIPRHNVQATDERAKGSRGIERDRNPGLEKSYSTIVKEKKTWENKCRGGRPRPSPGKGQGTFGEERSSSLTDRVVQALPVSATNSLNLA